MKTLIIILITCTLGCAQSKRDEQRTITDYSYIKVGASGKTTFCGMTKVTRLLTNKRILFKTDYITLDLKVVQRSHHLWIAVDSKSGIAYSIQTYDIDGEIGFIIIPNDMTTGVLGVVFCNTSKLCY